MAASSRSCQAHPNDHIWLAAWGYCRATQKQGKSSQNQHPFVGELSLWTKSTCPIEVAIWVRMTTSGFRMERFLSGHGRSAPLAAVWLLPKWILWNWVIQHTGMNTSTLLSKAILQWRSFPLEKGLLQVDDVFLYWRTIPQLNGMLGFSPKWCSLNIHIVLMSSWSL